MSLYNILVNQAKLFNNNLSEEQIDYIIKNNLLIYGNINENQNHEFLINENYAIEEITWFYDNNNYRIPYINNCKINKIKYDEKSNIFDYISSGSLIDNENIICGENFLKLSDVFIGSISSINANPNNSHFSKKIIEHKVRPTLMEPLWKVGGFLLGFATAIRPHLRHV
jgi:hypothetical protein